MKTQLTQYIINLILGDFSVIWSQICPSKYRDNIPCNGSSPSYHCFNIDESKGCYPDYRRQELQTNGKVVEWVTEFLSQNGLIEKLKNNKDVPLERLKIRKFFFDKLVEEGFARKQDENKIDFHFNK